ncbi:hypothetical protein ElyMa_002109400 [Elysia marginata]|uniref:Uncharacterized protein n=1 Tax=Elysia marginata TaxID=1093978 RepID=A0AAV4FFY9_9GAST|nr:hypothetical protein ElyMa_002109400 [Elysia marginata]
MSDNRVVVLVEVVVVLVVVEEVVIVVVTAVVVVVVVVEVVVGTIYSRVLEKDRNLHEMNEVPTTTAATLRPTYQHEVCHYRSKQ